LLQICIGLCAGERVVDLQSSGPWFKRFSDTEQYLLPCVSNLNWIWHELAFAFAFPFHLLYCSQFKACAELNILIIKMFHLFHSGWFVRLASGVINPNSENKTEVKWLQHLGWYSHWNIPSTSSVHSLEWTLNILFDVNLVNAFIAWLIHANVLYWTFIHVTCTLHVLEILGLYKNILLNSAWTFWSTF